MEEIHPLVPGFKDTPFILYLLKSQRKYLDRVYLEQEVTLNQHWLQVRRPRGSMIAGSMQDCQGLTVLLSCRRRYQVDTQCRNFGAPVFEARWGHTPGHRPDGYTACNI